MATELDLTQQNQQRKRFKISTPPETPPTDLLTPLEVPSGTGRTSPSCLLFSRAIPGTGNFITVQRIGNIFHQLGYDSEIFDTEQLTHEQTLELVSSQQSGGICIWLHAYRAGQFLVNLPDHLIEDRFHIIILGGTDVNCNFSQVSKATIIASAISKANVVVGFSKQMLTKLTTFSLEFNLTPQTYCIPQAVNTQSNSTFSLRQHLRVSQDCFVIIQVSGLRSVKDPEFLLKHLHEINIPDFVFVMIGAKLDESTTKQIEQYTNTFSNFYLLDVMPHDHLINCIQESSVGINTSHSEGMCNFILECMALETPIIARQNEGNVNLLKGHCGSIFCSPHQLIDAIHEVYVRSIDIQRMVRQAKHKINTDFSLQAEMEGYSAILNSTSH